MSSGRFSKLEFEGDKVEEKPTLSASSKSRHFVSQVRDAKYYLQQAEKTVLDGEHEKALRSYAAALGENPLLLEAWIGQVWMLLELEEYKEASLWSDKALEKFPDNPQLLAVKSIAFYRMGRQRDARGLNDVALQAKGEWVVVWVCRGELMLADNRTTAEECFRHATKLPETNKGRTFLDIGAIYLRYGEYCFALSYLQKATCQLPQAAWGWYLLGCTQSFLANSEQEYICYRQAYSLCPQNARYRKVLDEQPTGLHALWRKVTSKLFRR